MDVWSNTFEQGCLFRLNGEWSAFEATHRATLELDVRDYNADQLLNAAPDALASRLVERYTLEMPVLRAEAISTGEPRETKHPRTFPGKPEHPATVSGIEVEFHVPFTGDGRLFHVTPTRCSSSPPEAAVCSLMPHPFLIHLFWARRIEPEQLRESITGFLAEVIMHLEWLEPSITEWNAALPGQVRALIETRREKLLRDRHAVASLGFALRERPGAARTYAPPDVRLKLTPVVPQASASPWRPEPALSQAHYEHILKVLSDGAVLMERSPNTFKNMHEEDIRTVLLVLLNGHYEGQATGETFNGNGKTDILVRSEGCNIFIGECKVWGGPNDLTQALDQLLGYAGWRDTKVAVVIFNRNKDFSRVLDQVRPTVEAHPNFRRFVARPSETQFRFVFQHRDDTDREMALTVLLFNVPRPVAAAMPS